MGRVATILRAERADNPSQMIMVIHIYAKFYQVGSDIVHAVIVCVNCPARSNYLYVAAVVAAVVSGPLAQELEEPVEHDTAPLLMMTEKKTAGSQLGSQTDSQAVC